VANKLVIYKVEDATTGKIFEIEGPEGATADELGEFILSQEQASPSPVAEDVQAPASVGEGPRGLSPIVSPPPRERAFPERPLVGRSGFDQMAEGSQPIPMSDVEIAEFLDLDRNPNITTDQIGEFFARTNRPFGGPSERALFEAERAKRLEFLAKGGQLSDEVVYRDRVTDTLGEYVQQDDSGVGDLGAALEEGMAHNPMGILTRAIGDWTDSETVAGISKEKLRAKYPALSDEAIEDLHDDFIGELRRRELLNVRAQVESRDVNPLVRFGANMVGGSSPVDIIPLGRGITLGSRVAEGAAANMLVDAGMQAQDVSYGAQGSYDYGQTAMAGIEGAAMQGVLEGVIKGTSYIASTVNKRLNPSEGTVTPTTPADAPRMAQPTSRKNSKAYKAQVRKSGEAAVEHVDSLTKEWTNRPEFEVHENFEDLDGVDNDALGVTTRDDQGRLTKVQLNTENILAAAKEKKVDPEDVVSAVVFHEALGHYGLSQKFGDTLEDVLQGFYDNSVTTFKDKVDKWLVDHPREYFGDPKRTLRAAEEVLAEMSDKGRLPVTFVNRLANEFKALMRKANIKLKFSEREIKTILGMAHTAVVSGKGRDVAANGFRYMYAGANATKPPKTWLGMPDESRWFTGPDGKSRFEFSDAEAFLDLSSLSKMGRGTAYLPQVLEHKELFEQYPSLRNTRIRVKDTGEYTNGSYNSLTNLITVNENLSTEEKLSTILHEIQHNIQEIEGFARGGNPDMAVDAMPDAQVLNAGKNLLNYNENKLQEMQLKVGAIVAARNMPEGKRLIEDADIIQEIRTELEALEKKLQENSPTKRLSREDLLRNFEYRKLDEELTGFLPEFKASRKALRGALFPRGYLEASKEDRKEWGELAYNLEKGSDHIGNREYELYLAEEKQKSLRHDLAYDRADMVRIHLRRDEHIPFQAYESLLGEVEARDTQARQYMTMDERLATPAYTSQNEKVPADNYIIDGVEKASEMMSVNDNRYSKRKAPEADDQEKIRNAKEILEGALENYTPEIRSWAEGKRAARERGLTAKQIKGTKSIGELDKRLFQYDAVAEATDEKLVALHEKKNNGTFNLQDKHKYLETVFSYNELLANIFKDQAEIARAFNAMKALSYTKNKITALNDILTQFEGNPIAAFADEEVFNRFVKQVQLLMESGNSDGAHSLLRSVMKPYWWQKVLTFRHSMMLSGLGTHVKNAYDNASMIVREIEEQAVGMAGFPIRKGLQAAGYGVEDGVSPQEVAGRMYGILRAALDVDTYKNTRDAFLSGHGNREISSKVEMQDAKLGGILKPLNKVQDFLHASDTFFRAFHENANMYTLGIREARKQGFTGLAAFEEGSNIAINADQSMLDEARKMADVALLVDTPSYLASKLEATKAIRPGMSGGEQAGAFFANFIFPFFRVTDRLIFQKIRRMGPLALLDRVTREDLAAGGPRMDIALGRMALSSALIWYYWDQASEDKITPAGPSDPDKMAALMAGGYMPNAIKTEDKYIDATALNLSILPTNIQNSLAANVATIRSAYNKGLQDTDSTAKAIAFAGQALMTELASTSFAENLSMYIEPFQESAEWEKESATASMLAGMAGQFLPAAMRQYNQIEVDPVKRDTAGDRTISSKIEGRLKSAIPGLSDDLPVKYDLYGDPIKQGRSWTAINNYRDIKKDPVSQELQRLERTTDDAIVTGAPSSFQHEGEKIKLNAAGKQEWQRVQGGLIKDGMRNVLQSNEWKQASDAEKIVIVKEIKTEAYGLTKEYMLPLLGLVPEEESE
jgi:hypothetical protein